MSPKDRTPDQLDSRPERPAVERSAEQSRVGSAVTFGLRAAILASLAVSGMAAATAPQGIADDPVRLVSGTSTTCCPPAGEL